MCRILKSENALPHGFCTVVVREPSLFSPAVSEAELPENGGEEKRREAEELLARARREAGELLERARHEAAELLRQAGARRTAIEKEAYQAGYQQGYAEALKQAQEEAAEVRARAGSVLAEAERLRSEIIAATEPEVVELVRAVASRIIHRQLQVEPETVVSVVGTALNRLRSRGQVVVYVNPDDLDLVRSQRENLQQQAGEDYRLHFLGDPAVARGGCRVESEGGQVDATIDGQLRRLCQALGELLPAKSSEEVVSIAAGTEP